MRIRSDSRSVSSTCCDSLLLNLRAAYRRLNRMLVEHNALCSRWKKLIIESGMPASLACQDAKAVDGSEPASEQQLAFISSFKKFYQRWMIAGLAGPHLPIPNAVQIGLVHRPPHAEHAVTNMSLPRTAPPPPADVVTESCRFPSSTSDTAHLDEWMKIIAKSNTARQTLDRYSRLFTLAHCWRVLHERHSKACHQTKKRLVPVFADFLGVDADTIVKDLRLISKQMGPDWYPR